MAKPSWLTIDPANGEGSGDYPVQVSAIAYLGREPRSYVLTISSTKVTTPVVATVSQEGKKSTNATDWVEFDSGSEFQIDKDGGSQTITGKSNAQALTFSIAGSEITIPLPATYLAGSVSTSNGADIEGDPGKDNVYTFSITLAIPANSTTSERTAKLTVTTSGGATASLTLKQTAGDPYLWVGAEGQTSFSVTIPQDGTAQTIQILSNVNWTVE